MEPWMAWAAAHFAILSPDMAAAGGELALTVRPCLLSPRQVWFATPRLGLLTKPVSRRPMLDAYGLAERSKSHAGRLGPQDLELKGVLCGFCAWLIASCCRPGIWYSTVADAEMHGIRSRRHLLVIHPSRLHPPASWELGCTKVNQWWCSGSRWRWAEMSHSGVVGGGPAGHVQASWWLLVALALDTGQYMCHGSGANSDLLIEIDRHSYARFNVARSLSDRATRPFGA